ncbi:MAG: pyrroline-5-carboxylate reductase [Nitrospirota bacterium]
MIGFIGGGNMAEALIKGMAGQGMRDILVSEPREERRTFLRQAYGIRTTASNRDVASSCSIVVLAVKPQNMGPVLDEIAADVPPETTVVSIAAGISLAFLQSKLGTKRLVRVMPNTPSLVLEGMSVLSLCECFDDREVARVREIFMSVGKVLTLPEKYLDAVTAVSGSGPAFIALFVEAMIDAGGRLGLAREHAAELSQQTLLGTAKLLETGMTPEQLRAMVTSPGGTTAAGLAVFEEKGLKAVVADALAAAKRRAEELGNKA